MAIFDNNMAVGKSENLVTLHPHDLTQPFLRGCSDFEEQPRFFCLYSKVSSYTKQKLLDLNEKYILAVPDIFFHVILPAPIY